MIYPFQTDNPYAIVREEQWTEEKDGIRLVHTKSYDAKNRLVGYSSIRYRGDESIGHFAVYVEADGYWYGGAHDSDLGIECIIRKPFTEGELF